MKRAKTVKIMCGTDIPFCTPSHPVSVVLAVKNVVDRIASSSDTEFTYNCNTLESIRMFKEYGSDVHGLDVIFYLNGVKSSYSAVCDDLQRGADLITQIIKEAEK